MTQGKQVGSREINAVINGRKLLTHQEAFKQTIEFYNIPQAEICQRVTFLNMYGYGRAMDSAQLSRWLQGKRDMEVTTLETLELTLAFPDQPHAYLYYRQLRGEADLSILVSTVLKTASLKMSVIGPQRLRKRRRHP
ncbi:hypothetical protein [Synechococcus sp. PCC 6312]|uniref:hypothetical protein n=1 Tax=Synechococcus sp. (strain ATCC 27167 / PCC 6312) TaxID=195253 RepID=UPI00029EFF84|nr:hypothetical protein [Synechococcus sp. PCC 6312]AFY62374.1 hypothetical protein Syn6312_3337 [Synechococcus sp. PCC 6312]